MPGGVPVATVALNGAKNAGILAAQMLSIGDTKIAERVMKFKNDLRNKIEDSADNLKKEGYPSEF